MSDAEPWADEDPATHPLPEERRETRSEPHRHLGGHASVLVALVLLVTRMHL